ncbi:MAG: O-antigen ligase family protein [Crocinitomicaceae bacterium]|nr:O-antigen ligase family protein [Crocinitomicaceae bacterium]
MNALKKISITDLSIFALACVALQLPVYHLYISLTIGAWILLSFTAAIVQRNSPRLNFGTALMMVFYVLISLGKLWSDNKGLAGFDMEVKMSFVILPFVMMFVRYERKHLKFLLYTFLLGLIVGCASLLTEAYLDYRNTNALAEFFYVELSRRVHPSYYSYYLNIAISLLLVDYITESLGMFRRKGLYLILIAGFSIFSLLLVSKNGIIISILLLLILLVFWIVKRKIILVVLTVTAMLGTSYFVYIKSSNMQARIDEMMRGLSSEENENAERYSTGIRIAIWKEAVYLIKESPIIGYGPGDVTDALIDRYDKKGLTIALVRRLNAHNQFLQTTLSIGIVGLSILFAILLYPFFLKKKNKWFAIGLVLITIAFFATESVLETQAGVISFVLFYSLLVSVEWNNEPKIEEY